MTKKALTRQQKVYKQLASSGRYVNTGKVLIGLSYQPRPPAMTQGEELIQGILLGTAGHVSRDRAIVFFAVVLVVCASLFVSCRA
jgi:hypothetical protein